MLNNKASQYIIVLGYLSLTIFFDIFRQIPRNINYKKKDKNSVGKLKLTKKHFFTSCVQKIFSLQAYKGSASFMEWIEQLNSAINYIEEHLEDGIDLEKVAEIACCSSFHFQRMFS